MVSREIRVSRSENTKRYFFSIHKWSYFVIFTLESVFFGCIPHVRVTGRQTMGVEFQSWKSINDSMVWNDFWECIWNYLFHRQRITFNSIHVIFVCGAKSEFKLFQIKNVIKHCVWRNTFTWRRLSKIICTYSRQIYDNHSR